MNKETKTEDVAKPGPLGPKERRSVRRKREVTLRLLRGILRPQRSRRRICC